MTTADMLVDLGHRLEDVDNDRFGVNIKLIALNRAQDRVIMYLNRQLLTEIDIKETQVQVSSTGELALTSLDNTIRGGANGIDGIWDVGQARFLQKVSLEEYKDHKNGTRRFLASIPVYYVWGSKVFLLEAPEQLTSGTTAVSFASGGSGKTTVTSVGHGFKTGNVVTLSYTKVDSNTNPASTTTPTTAFTVTRLTDDTFSIALNYGSNTAYSNISWTADGFIEIYYLKQPLRLGGNDCELNEMIHEIIVDLAEGDLWNMDNKSDRNSMAMDRAFATIQMLNNKYVATESLRTRSPYEIDNDVWAEARNVKII